MPLTNDGVNVRRRGRRVSLTGSATPQATPHPDDAQPEAWLVNQVKQMDVDDVVEAVDAGMIDPVDAVAAERAGRNRVTLVARVERMR